jgi:uncharacterized membrane protein
MIVYVLITIVAWAVQLLINIGTIKIILDILDKGTAKVSTFFSFANLLGKFILGSLLYLLIVLGGFILLVIPGIIWGIKYSFFTYLIVDKNLGPMEAIKKSGEITAGKKGKLFGLFLLFMLINILGAVCFLVGLFVTIPITMLTGAYVYRKLMGEIAVSESVPAVDLPAEETAA